MRGGAVGKVLPKARQDSISSCTLLNVCQVTTAGEIRTAAYYFVFRLQAAGCVSKAPREHAGSLGTVLPRLAGATGLKPIMLRKSPRSCVILRGSGVAQQRDDTERGLTTSFQVGGRTLSGFR